MSHLPTLAETARTAPYAAAMLAVLLAVLAYSIRRVRRTRPRTPAAVLVAALGAMLCTAYSGDTSWSFARDHLAMHGVGERAVMFAAGELALFAVALMARQNLNTDGAPGTPGVLVWVITGVQVIPAYSESGIVAGTVRAFVGPVLAALLWHLAMGIELRHTKPGKESQSLPAVLVRELRERTLSHLGLSVRGRDAAQITRDRWTGIATRRAAVLAELEAATKDRPRRTARARRRLAVAVDRTDAGVLPEQRAVLLDRIAARRYAADLASMTLTSPWAGPAPAPLPPPAEVTVERVPDAVPEVYPEIEQAVPVPVPADARLLPIVARPTAAAPEVLAPVPDPRVQADPVHALRDRIGDDRFRALWPEVEPEPVDDSPPPPGEDTLTVQARRDFLGYLVEGAPPSIRALRTRYGIGQQRASRVQSELKKALV